MKQFIDMARSMTERSTPANFGQKALDDINVGRLIALELIDALRGGEQNPDVLSAFTTLAGNAGSNNVLRGYFRELQTQLAKGLA